MPTIEQSFIWSPCKDSKRQAVNLMRYLNTHYAKQVGTVWYSEAEGWAFRLSTGTWKQYPSRAAAIKGAETELRNLLTGDVEFDRSELTP